MKTHLLRIAMPIIGMLLFASAFSATYYSQGSLAPNSLSSWNTNRGGGGSQPLTFNSALTSDRFVVQNTHTMTTTATWGLGGIIGSQLQIENGGVLVANHSVTIGALLGSSFQIDNGGKYTHNNTSSIALTIFNAATITLSAGSIFQVNGTAAISLPSRTYSNLIINNTASVDAAGNITVSATLTINASCFFDLLTNRLIDGGSFLNSGTGTLKTQSTNASPIPAGATWAGTVQYNSTSVQTVVSGNYNNLTISNTNSANASGDITVSSVLTVAASCTFNAQTNRLINGGSFSNSGTGTIKTQSTNASPIPAGATWAGTVQYNSTSVQTVAGGSYNNLTISNTNSANASGDVTVSSVLTVDASCIFNAQTNRLINGGSFSNSGTGTIRTQSTNASPIPAGISWPGTITYNAASDQTVAGASYNNLTISSTGTKTLAADISIAGTFTLSAATDYLAINGNHLTINGTTSLTGAIKGSATSKLTVGGSAGGSPNIKLNAAASDSMLQHLTLNRTGTSAGLTLASNVGITGLLTITSGNFNINSRIVSLKSTSIASTAQLATVSGTISYGTTGSFTLERFIPQGNRAYRDLAPGLSSTNTVFTSWQENGAYPVVGNGIYVTGIVGADGVNVASGLDQTQSGSRSMHSYVGGAWSDITNTYFAMNPYQGYRVLIRGDRNFLLSTVPQPTAMNNSTVLRINGLAITGTLNYSSTGITNGSGTTVSTYALSNTVNGYTLLGNPYPAAIDWNVLSRTNMSGSYWYYDGTIGTGGAFVSWNGTTNSNPSSAVNRYLQPGQGFFVQTTSSSPTMSIVEIAKATGSTLTNIFRSSTDEPVNKLSFVLLKDIADRGFVNMDGATIVCSSVTNADAGKFTNTTENLSINKWGKQLSIQQREPFMANDSVLLKLTKVVNGASYKIALDTRNFVSGLQPVLVDKYLNVQKTIKANDTTAYAFTINTADTFSFSNRFKVVFVNNAGFALPLSSLALTAKKNNASIDLSWHNENEEQVKKYELEHSSNGISFNKVHETGTVAGNYHWKHNKPAPGKNSYRIKLVYADGKTEYSSIVSAELALYSPSITFNGGSIRSGNAAFNISGLVNGPYELKLVNAMGQLLASKPFVYDGTMQYKLDRSINAAGTYTIMVTNKQTGEKMVKQFFMGQ